MNFPLPLSITDSHHRHLMKTPTLPMLEFILKSYHHLNAAALKNALLDYHRHINNGGKMFWAVAGALSGVGHRATVHRRADDEPCRRLK